VWLKKQLVLTLLLFFTHNLCVSSKLLSHLSLCTHQVSVFRKAANPTKKKVMINKKLYNDDKNGGDSGWVGFVGCFDVVGNGSSIIESEKREARIMEQPNTKNPFTINCFISLKNPFK
jgi:hypothetical protein